MADDPSFPLRGSSRYSFGTSARIFTEPAELDPPAKGVSLLTAGDITIRTVNGPDIPYVGVPSGFSPPFVVVEIVSLGSGATGDRCPYETGSMS